MMLTVSNTTCRIRKTAAFDVKHVHIPNIRHRCLWSSYAVFYGHNIMVVLLVAYS